MTASKALVIARRHGSAVTSIDEVRGYELTAAVLDEMGLVGEVSP